MYAVYSWGNAQAIAVRGAEIYSEASITGSALGKPPTAPLCFPVGRNYLEKKKTLYVRYLGSIIHWQTFCLIICRNQLNTENRWWQRTDCNGTVLSALAVLFTDYCASVSTKVLLHCVLIRLLRQCFHLSALYCVLIRLLRQFCHQSAPPISVPPKCCFMSSHQIAVAVFSPSCCSMCSHQIATPVFHQCVVPCVLIRLLRCVLTKVQFPPKRCTTVPTKALRHCSHQSAALLFPPKCCAIALPEMPLS